MFSDIRDSFLRYAPDPHRWSTAESELQNLVTSEAIDIDFVVQATGYGGFLSRTVARFPELVTKAHRALLENNPDQLFDHAPSFDPTRPTASLRDRRNWLLASIGLAQNSQIWSPEQVWQALSLVADKLIQEAYNQAKADIVEQYGQLLTTQGTPADLCILGYGKLGSRELNFSSDVDLVAICPQVNPASEGGEAGTTDAGTYLRKLAQKCFTLLDERTDRGFVYRVDLRLRPNGSQGALVVSIDSFVDYYRAWSSNWERIALLRARPVAGDQALGTRALEALNQYIFPQHLDFASLEDMRYIKDKIDRESVRRQKRGYDIKLGKGGIRELEFLVQNLQIIFGGKRTNLQTIGTLSALDALMVEGIVPKDIGIQLKNAYCFLRHVENVLQAKNDRQTQILPKGDDAQILARACGFVDSGGVSDFQQVLKQHRNVVEEEFRNLYRKAAKAEAEIPRPIYELTENPELKEERLLKLLGELGFINPEDTSVPLKRLLAGPKARGFGLGAREQYDNVLPTLLFACTGAPHPDRALVAMAEFVEQTSGRSHLYALLRENVEVVKALAMLFSGSKLLTRFFLRSPELLDSLVLRTHATPKQDAEILSQRMHEPTTGALSSDLEDVAIRMRKAKLEEMLRIGFNDLIAEIQLFDVQEQLTALADGALTASLNLAFQLLAEKWQLPPGSNKAITPVAMGKMGAKEMSYNSDLDIIFIVFPEENVDLERAVRWTQRTVSILQTKSLEGNLYDVDLRLRPSGNQGMLVTTFDAFSKYHQTEAAIWERIALTKARPLGNHANAIALRQEIDRICYAQPPSLDDIDEMVRIHSRMVEERGSAEPLKASAGATADIEITLALVQMYFGHQSSRFRETNPWKLLTHLQTCPAPFPDVAVSFQKALYSFRVIENRLRLLLDKPTSKLPESLDALNALKKSLKFSNDLDIDIMVQNLQQEVVKTRTIALEALRSLAL